jgi:hypothetical protein
MARMTAYFASRAGKIAGAERSRKFLLWRSYGDNPLSSNVIEQMASYRSYSATEPIGKIHKYRVKNIKKYFY